MAYTQKMRTSNLDPVMDHELTGKPVRIQPQYRFDSANTPKVPCHYHPNSYIKYFCKTPDCLMPLCEQCQQIHLEEHKQNGVASNILPYEHCLNEIYVNLAATANRICDLNNHLQQLAEYQTIHKLEQKTSLRTNPIQLINSAREQVQSIVNNYFNTLITFIQTKVPEYVPEIDPTPTFRELKNVWDKNIEDLEMINRQETIEKVIEYYEGNLQQRNEQCIFESDKVAKLMEQQRPDHLVFGLEIPQLNVDPSYLQKFLWDLERYAYFIPPFPEFREFMPPPIEYVEPRIIREPIVIREPVYYRDDYNNYRDDDDYYQEQNLVKSRPIIDEPVQRPVDSEGLSKSPTRRKHRQRSDDEKITKTESNKHHNSRKPGIKKVQQVVHHVNHSGVQANPSGMYSSWNMAPPPQFGMNQFGYNGYGMNQFTTQNNNPQMMSQNNIPQMMNQNNMVTSNNIPFNNNNQQLLQAQNNYQTQQTQQIPLQTNLSVNNIPISNQQAPQTKLNTQQTTPTQDQKNKKLVNIAYL